VLVRGKEAVFVKSWGGGAVVRYDALPNEPKVVPLDRVEPIGGERGGAPLGAPPPFPATE
jgi:hypothetical protein